MEHTDIKTAAEKVMGYLLEHQDVLKEISNLNVNKLEMDLADAVKYKNGYYKNDKGVYWYLKGIEVYNNINDLGRMGFNGEDRGVWVHYCEVDDKKAVYHNVPICVFLSAFNSHFTNPDELMRPTTKEDFDKQVKKTVENIISPYEEKRPAEEYLEVIGVWREIFGQPRLDAGVSITSPCGESLPVDC